MKRSMWRLMIVLLAVAVFLPGCVYLRLLKLQQQFEAFADYVSLDRINGLGLNFHRPVLLLQDVIWLMKGKAAIHARCGRYTIFKYEFPKQCADAAAAEADSLRVAVVMIFQDDKLVKIRFPEEFAKAIHPELIERSLRSMGRGKVNQDERTVSADVDAEDEAQSVVMPTQPEVEQILGAPYALTKNADENTLYYQYAVRLDSSSNQAAPPVVDVWFTFHAGTKSLKKARFTFHKLTAAINFK